MQENVVAANVIARKQKCILLQKEREARGGDAENVPRLQCRAVRE